MACVGNVSVFRKLRNGSNLTSQFRNSLLDSLIYIYIYIYSHTRKKKKKNLTNIMYHSQVNSSNGQKAPTKELNIYLYLNQFCHANTWLL